MPSDKASKPTSQPENGNAGADLKRALELIGKIIAPTTVIAALLYYFGWARSNAIYGYFGIDQSILGFSNVDYLLRSIVAAFEPLRWLLILGLATIWFNHWFVRQTEKKPGGKHGRRLRWLAHIVLILGLLFLLGGPVIFLIGLKVVPLVFPLTWVVGVALTSYGAHLCLLLKAKQEEASWAADLPKGLRQATLGIVIAMLCFSLFWFVAMYADVVGSWEAEQLASKLADRPCVVVFSRVPLSLERDGIQVQQMTTEQDAYQYRYSGLRFLVRSADRFFLLPSNWSQQHPNTIIIPDTDAMRVEVIPGRFCAP